MEPENMMNRIAAMTKGMARTFSGSNGRRWIAAASGRWLVAAGVVLLSACATQQTPLPVTNFNQTTVTNTVYRVQPFDTVQTIVFQEPDLCMKIRVSEAGTVNYPFLGTVHVAGLTTAEVESMLTSRLSKGFLINPRVNVVVESSVKSRGHVVILGQVRTPGTYDFSPDEPLTLLQAIGRAGGFTDIAAGKRVIILRSENGKEHKMIVNVSAIMKGEMSNDVVLKPGDIISVPQILF